jgi:hypothetical protein
LSGSSDRFVPVHGLAIVATRQCQRASIVMYGGTFVFLFLKELKLRFLSDGMHVERDGFHLLKVIV